jgi:DNA polymerase-4
MVKKIIHVDMDCFYAAVEMRDNPVLKNQAVAVGGDRDRRGVISTCNYKAREFGVRSAMSTGMARNLCPSLVLMPSRMQVYVDISHQIRVIFNKYSEHVEPLSLDEAFLDVSDCTQCHGSASLIAEQIRQEIFDVTGLTASAGIAPNKFMAKIASDLNKPNGQYVITPDDVEAFSLNMPLNKINGVGKVTFSKLEKYGLLTGYDIRQADPDFLNRHFGKLANVLIRRAHGIDNSKVVSNRVRKSVGVERTLPHDITTISQCQEVIDRLYPELLKRIERAKDGLVVHKQGIKLKFDDFQSTSVETSSIEADYACYIDLLHEAIARSEGRHIRLVGLNVGVRALQSTEDHDAEHKEQLDLF